MVDDKPEDPAGRLDDRPAGHEQRHVFSHDSAATISHLYGSSFGGAPQLSWKERFAVVTAIVAFIFSLYNFLFETVRGADLRMAGPKTVGLFFESCNKFNDKNYVRVSMEAQFVNLGGPKSIVFLQPASATLSYNSQKEKFDFGYHFSASAERYFGSESHCARLSDGSIIYNGETKYISVGKRDFSPTLVLEPNKPVSFQFFFAPGAYNQVRSKQETLEALKSNQSIYIEFILNHSQNLNFLNWINWQDAAKSARVSCQITINDDIVNVFAERGYFSVGRQPYATCRTDDIKSLPQVSDHPILPSSGNASSSQ